MYRFPYIPSAPERVYLAITCFENSTPTVGTKGSAWKYAYLVQMVYPMSPEFFNEGKQRVYSFLKGKDFPVLPTLTLETTRVVKKDGETSVEGNNSLLLRVSHEALEDLDQDTLLGMFSAFYDGIPFHEIRVRLFP
jgi:hypothetical protein